MTDTTSASAGGERPDPARAERPADTQPIEYVLPILRHELAGQEELARYLEWLAARVDVTVVDASPPLLYDELSRRLPATVRHVRPTAAGLNGKARGVMTGLRLARHDAVIVADDDVRYDDRSLAATRDLLADAEFVRLQNIYTTWPWYARWDTARSLVGRAFGGDFGGTVALRRRALDRAGGYSTDVLFENLELERTVRFSGGRTVIAKDVLVPRLTPTLHHFAGQRVRQSYDDFAQPGRLAVELAILPVVFVAAIARRWGVIALLGLASIVVAEAGRRSGSARTALPPTAALWAPAWVVERGVTVWIALWHRLRGGIPYAGSRIYAAATPLPLLRRRLNAKGRSR